MSQLSPPIGIAVFGLCLLSIYFRGYLVPGTPALTKRYLPDRILRLFDKHQPTSGPPDEDVDVEAVLQAANVVAECDDHDDLCLTDSFQRAWRDRVTALRAKDTNRDDLAELLDSDPGRLDIEDYGEAFVARLNGTRIGQWESQAAFIADIAAASELHDRYSHWRQLDLQQQSSILNGLRVFLDQCPVCDGPVTLDQEVVESCCRSIDIVAVSCTNCGSRLFEAEQPTA